MKSYKTSLAIFVDELSGRDQMGQKPFFKKSWGHIKRLERVMSYTQTHGLMVFLGFYSHKPPLGDDDH